MVPDRQKVWKDGQKEWMDDAKTISLRLRRGIKRVNMLKKFAYLYLWSLVKAK